MIMYSINPEILRSLYYNFIKLANFFTFIMPKYNFGKNFRVKCPNLYPGQVYNWDIFRESAKLCQGNVKANQHQPNIFFVPWTRLSGHSAYYLHFYITKSGD